MSRLSASASPYLRSHAGQPVAWYPWGEEAFAEARRRDVPVLVSIGYSTCHWCHVMAAESFSDADTAALMNRDLVAIKVDREEHPEVDAVMMAAASAFTPNLGWPLSVFTTPAGRPFFAGTYWPKEARAGHPAFRDVVAAVSEAWTERRDAVGETAEALQRALVAAAAEVQSSSALPSGADLAALVDEIAAREDRIFGGFAASDAPIETPKFPTIPVLRFLQQRGLRSERPDAAALAARTFDAMADSPLRDSVDGGFFRYATRRDWTVPHYERMLTDNAGLIEVALDAGRGDIAEGVAGFLLDTLQVASGGFGAAQDSESVIDERRTEGGFYLAGAAERVSLAAPAVDGKVVTAWNGSAIAALARTGARRDAPALIAAARQAVDAVQEANVDADGFLRRASLDEIRSPASATLEDYGAYAGGLLRLAMVTGELAYAREARRLVDLCIVEGALRTPGGRDPVLAGLAAPPVDDADIDRPGGASAVADAALTLWELGVGEEYRGIAERIVRDGIARAVAEPFAHGSLLGVAARLTTAPRQIVVVVAEAAGDPLARAAFAADADTVVRVDVAGAAAWAEAGFSLLADRTAVGGRSTAYDCRGFVCLLPVHVPADLAVETEPKAR
ncbi:DUF255 domain-containing protein [Microbacterium sp. cx-55]|uniref:thioredoxin domain-containing protein n=1 Tax=Microbacterium sp. cx-55 TaxID=2875948 RepID=UPI001CBE68EB|nr:DUF255 domain-containing protein [Microbacterium sp. cx-55]MBZ4485770.1 DUF255 domain-containing protein [Microbacterium sp. cx-55]UGB34346.1 DUF255 domain-containing protein [Microbacterium sp. cx-55]